MGIGNKRNASETAEAVALEKSEAASEREARQAVKASRWRGRELEADDKAAAKAAAEAAAKAKATEGRAARTKAAAAAAAEAATNRAPPWKERPAGWPEKEDTDEGSEVDSEAEGEEMIEVGAYVWAKEGTTRAQLLGTATRLHQSSVQKTKGIHRHFLRLQVTGRHTRGRGAKASSRGRRG